MKSYSTKSGFSLVEVVIVILIMGIMASMTIPMMRKSSTGYRADLAAHRLASDLNLSATHARATGQSVTVEFQLSNNDRNGGYLINGIVEPQLPERSWIRYQFGDSPYAATLDQAPTKITFNRHGYPDQDATIVINDLDKSRRVIMLSADSGKVTVQ